MKFSDMVKAAEKLMPGYAANRATDVSKNHEGANFVTKDKPKVKFGYKGAKNLVGNANMTEDMSYASPKRPFKPGRVGQWASLKVKKTPPAYGKGGKKGRFQYGKTVKGYVDPLE